MVQKPGFWLELRRRWNWLRRAPGLPDQGRSPIGRLGDNVMESGDLSRSAVMQQSPQSDLLKNTLTGRQLQHHADREAQHCQATIEQFGPLMEAPTLVFGHDPHLGLKGPWIIQTPFIGTPALAFRFGKAAPGQRGAADQPSRRGKNRPRATE
jgi:hypothetical protein